jgi:hypothetical protein
MLHAVGAPHVEMHPEHRDSLSVMDVLLHTPYHTVIPSLLPSKIPDINMYFSKPCSRHDIYIVDE